MHSSSIEIIDTPEAVELEQDTQFQDINNIQTPKKTSKDLMPVTSASTQKTTTAPVIQAGDTGFSFVDIANLGVALAIIFAAGMSVFYIFIGGISFILSGGEEDKVKQAVHTIRYAIIGLIITIFAVTIIAILGSIFNFDLISYIQWSKITEMMRRIVENITQGSNTPTGGSLQ
ncbi:MAG: hypothetical protein N4A36_02300 [Candidatus Gracilibacteria bacterium]|jgi:hypothetical protein|nr:hypothetical protein [Candidatus Gracilibacteria bacterium]